jgi:uncharacterized protein (DUF58 family)
MRERLWARFARPGKQENLPIKLGRKRIYTLPTGAGWMLAGLLLICVLASLNYNSNVGLGFGLLLVSAALTALVACHQRLDGLEIIEVVGEPGHAGDVVMVRVVVRTQPGNHGLILRADNSQTTFEVDAQGRGVARLELPAKQRGAWVLPRLAIATRQPLGVSTAWAWFWARGAKVLVWPALETEQAPLPPMSDGERQARNSQTHNQDVRSLRPYRPGDSIRQIAWKQSARLATPVVREYERPAGHATIDWATLSHLGPEKRLSRIATWVVEAERCGRATHLRLPGRQLGPRRGESHKRACLDALAEMPSHVH